MAKYQKLGPFLRDQTTSEIPITFAEVERVIGQKLPRSARYPAWWSNNPSNNVMTKIWLEAGYKTEQVNVDAKTLVFRRVQPPEPSKQSFHPAYGSMKGLVQNVSGMAESTRVYTAATEGKTHTKPPAANEPSAPKDGYYPFFNSMKGLITIAPGVDLTEPADPEWGKLAEKKYGKKK